MKSFNYTVTPLALLLTIALASCSSDDAPPVTSCERLREHLVTLRLADATGVDRKAHAEAMRSALGSDFVERCKESMSESEVKCVLKATDSTSASACVPTNRK